MRDCLTMSGNNVFTAPDDGTPEWNNVSASWTAACEWLLDEHDWNFATDITEKEAEVDASDEFIEPDDPNFGYRFKRPDDALHVIKVMDEGGNKLTDYRIIGNKIYANVDTILVESVVEPDPDDWPGLFTKAIKHCIFAGIYRGLNKDAAAAQKEEALAERTMGKSRPRSDLQDPSKAKFTSTLATSRSRRRG